MKDTKLIFSHPGFEKIEENIWLIRNFVNSKESKQYVEVAESVDEEEWWTQSSGWYAGKYLNISNKPIINVSLDIAERFKNLFEFKKEYSFGLSGSIHRILPGQDMHVHPDFPELDNIEEEHVLFNGAIYHNDFDGGALYYPELSIEYKPNPGDLVMHPGTTKYRHGVSVVTGNKIRYMSNIWVADSLGMSIKTSGYLEK